MPGRMEKLKRQDLLIQAFRPIKTTMPEARLLLVGDGPEREALAQLSRRLGLCEHVHFAGYRSDRERCLAAMDVFTLSSDSEGTPLALLEAWAARLPVVATAVGGLRELIEHGLTGLLVPPGDSERLARALQRLLADEALRQTLAAAGNAAVCSRFTLSAMAHKYANEYHEILHECSRKSVPHPSC